MSYENYFSFTERNNVIGGIICQFDKYAYRVLCVVIAERHYQIGVADGENAIREGIAVCDVHTG